MFDIGFFELLIIAIVGLVVIGPERLPSTIKTCALWFGRIKRSITDARQEIEQQLGADEIRRQLHNEQIMHNLEKMKDTRHELEARINEWQKLGSSEGDSNAQPEAHSHGEHSTDTSHSEDKQAEDRESQGNELAGNSNSPAENVGQRAFPSAPDFAEHHSAGDHNPNSPNSPSNNKS